MSGMLTILVVVKSIKILSGCTNFLTQKVKLLSSLKRKCEVVVEGEDKGKQKFNQLIRSAVWEAKLSFIVFIYRFFERAEMRCQETNAFMSFIILLLFLLFVLENHKINQFALNGFFFVNRFNEFVLSSSNLLQIISTNWLMIQWHCK